MVGPSACRLSPSRSPDGGLGSWIDKSTRYVCVAACERRIAIQHRGQFFSRDIYGWVKLIASDALHNAVFMCLGDGRAIPLAASHIAKDYAAVGRLFAYCAPEDGCRHCAGQGCIRCK